MVAVIVEVFLLYISKAKQEILSILQPYIT